MLDVGGCDDGGLWLDFPLTSLLKLQFWFRVAAASTAHVAQGVKVTNRRPQLWREQLDAAFPPLPLPIHLPIHTPLHDHWTMEHVHTDIYEVLLLLPTDRFRLLPHHSPALHLPIQLRRHAVTFNVGHWHWIHFSPSLLSENRSPSRCHRRRRWSLFIIDTIIFIRLR